MKKILTLDGLDCANCAAKIEKQINDLENIKASVSFVLQKLTLEADEESISEAVNKAKKIIKQVDPDIVIGA